MGPKKTSELARQLGQQVADLKRAASDLQAQLVSGMPIQTLTADPVQLLRRTIADLLTPVVTAPENELQEPKRPPIAAHLAHDASADSPQGIADSGLGEPH